MANEIKLKKWDADNDEWVQQYPEVRHTDIIASGTNNSVNYLAGDGSWKAPLYYVVGNTTGTAGSWTGTISNLSAYYDGLTIRYKMGIAGATNVYLNINNLGNAQVYRYGGARLTTHWPVGTICTLTYNSSDNRWYANGDYNSTDDYRMRWQGDVAVGTLMHGYQIIMEGADRKFHPVTEGGSTANTNTVSTVDFLVGGTILYHYSGNNQDVDSTGIGYEVYESGQFGSMEYFNNRDSGWATARYPFYFKGTINSSGHFNLDNTSYTSWLTQTLPTSDDGFVYIQIGYMVDSYDDFRLASEHPIYIYKDGALRLYPYFPEFNGGTITNNLTVSSGTSGDAFLKIEADTDNNDENDNPYLQFNQDGGNTIVNAGITGDAGTIFTNSLANAGYFGHEENASVQFYTSGLARLTIREDGDVGINTTSPATGYKLDVNGKIRSNNDIVASNFVDYNNGNYYVNPASTSNINNLTIQGDLTVNGTTTTLDTTVSTTDQWTVTNAGTDIATIINQTGTADILDVRDNGTSVFKVKDGGGIDVAGNVRIESGSFASLILDRSTTGAGSVLQFENNNGLIGGIGAFGDDGLQFRTANGTQMVLSSADRLGIGTQSPASKLDVDGNVRFYRSGQSALQTYSAKAGLELAGYQSTSGSPYTKTSDIVANADGTVASQMRFFTKASGSSSPTEQMRIESDGTVQFNADRVRGKSVNGERTLLDYWGGIRFTWDSDTYGNNDHHSIRSTYGNTWGDDLTINSFHHLRVNIDANNNNTDARFEIGHNTTGTENTLFVVNENGNVGIGDDRTPDEKLQVDGAGIFNSNSGQRVLYLRQSSAGVGNILQFQGASNENVWELVGRDSHFYIYNNDLSKYAMYIEDSNNRIGINGHNTPSVELDVKGQIRAFSDTSSKIWSENTGGGQASLELKNSETHLRFIADNGGFQLYDQIDGASRFEIDTNGNSKIIGNLTVQSTYPRIYLTDTDSNNDFSIINGNGTFSIYDDTAGLMRMQINSSGDTTFSSGAVVATDYMYAHANLLTKGNLYLNYDNNPAGADATIYFGDDASDTAHNLIFDNSVQRFKFSNAVESVGSIITHANLYLNYDNSPAGTDPSIYFGDDTADSTHYIQFDNSGQRFKVSNTLDVIGSITTSSNLYLNYDNSPTGTDAYIYFGDDTSDSTHWLRFDNSAQQFGLSNRLVGTAGRLGAIEYNGSDVDKVNFELDTSTQTLTITTS